MAEQFDAFISYSRRASAALATDLQSAVERFAKPWYKLRAVRVFRDDASMAANTALWSNIEQGLRQAEWFVLLASPAAAASQYVANEVTWWLQHKSADRILIVLEEGVDIVWDSAGNDFDWERIESLPRALSHAFAEEPRWIDLRWYEAEGSLQKSDPRWEERVADVAAALRFADRDQLIGENVREHKRAQRLLRAGITTLSMLLVLAVVAAFIAVGQRNEAERQRDAAATQARIALARQLAAQALSLAPTDLQTASLLAVQAFRTNDDAQTRAALFQIATASPKLVRPLDVGAPVTASAVTPAGLVVTGDNGGTVQLWDGQDATPVGHLGAPVQSVAVSPDGLTLAAAGGGAVRLWRDGSESVLTDLRGAAYVQVDASSSYLAATDNGSRTVVWSLAGEDPTLVGSVRAHGSDLAFGTRGLSLYSTITKEWFLIDPSKAQLVARGDHVTPMGFITAVAGDGATFASFSGGVDIDVWRGEAAFGDGDRNAVAHTNLASGQALALSADGTLVATQGDGRVEVAAVQGREEAAERPTVLDGAGPLDPGAGQALAFGGNRYLLSATGDTALLWDLTQFNRFGTAREAPVPQGCRACGPGRIVVSPDGSRALLWATGTFEDGPVVVDLASGTFVAVAPDLGPRLEGLAWHGNDQLVGFDTSRGALVSWSLGGASAEVVAEIDPEFSDSIMDASVAGDRAYLIARSARAFVIDLGTGAVLSKEALLGDARTTEGYYWRLAPDGSTAYVAAYEPDFVTRVIVVLDVATDEIAFAGPGLAAAYDASSRLHVFDGQTVATLNHGELVDRRPAPSVETHPAPVVSPDGRLVATGGVGNDIRLLDLEREGSVFGTVAVPHHDNLVPVSEFTPDGATLVTAVPPAFGFDQPPSVRTLSLEPDDWIAAACAVAARDLIEEDWDRYVGGPAPDDLRCVQ